MGMKEDLNLKGDNFSDATTAAAVTQLLGELPNGIYPI